MRKQVPKGISCNVCKNEYATIFKITKNTMRVSYVWDAKDHKYVVGFTEYPTIDDEWICFGCAKSLTKQDIKKLKKSIGELL